ncbi:hypothetical protein Bca4012_062780 [Brassica carinata]
MSAARYFFRSAASRASATASRFSTVPKPIPAASSRSAFRMPKQTPLSSRILSRTELLRGDDAPLPHGHCFRFAQFHSLRFTAVVGSLKMDDSLSHHCSKAQQDL